MRDVNTPDSKKALFVITEDVVEDVCSYVAQGGSIARWCVLNRLQYGTFRKSLRDNRAYEMMLVEALKDREEWLKDELLQLMADIMRFDPREAYDENGNILPMNDMPEHVAKMIKKSKTVRVEHKDGPPDVVDQLEYWDKQKAIDQLGKHLQMFIERIEVNHKMTLEESIQKSREKNK